MSRSSEPCSIQGCELPTMARGWCSKHYYRWSRNGDPEKLLIHTSPSIADRLWSRVDKSGDCWLWTAGKTTAGYGSFGFDGRTHYAHRVSFELVVGAIPDGFELDHLCFTRACVNPEHLEPVTPQENKRRMVEANHKTSCPQGHPYEGANVFFEADGSCKCRACRRAYDRKRRPRQQVSA